MRSTLLMTLCTIFMAACTMGASTQLSQNGTLTYTGECTCIECHKKIVNSFKTHQHNEAFANLESDNRYQKLKKEGWEGSCLKCHVTGYGEVGGFVSPEKTPELAKVSCEACHGPGSEHAKAENAAKKNTIQRKPDCGRCHLIHTHEK